MRRNPVWSRRAFGWLWSVAFITTAALENSVLKVRRSYFMEMVLLKNVVFYDAQLRHQGRKLALPMLHVVA
jgi:hypothetical protein